MRSRTLTHLPALRRNEHACDVCVRMSLGHKGDLPAWLTVSAFGNCEIGLGDRHGPIVLQKLKLSPWQNCREGPPHIAFGWE